MRFLLDTNVLSEPLKRSPDARVARWWVAQSALDLCVSVLSIGELTMGFELLADGARRRELEQWITQDLPRQFIGRVLPIDAAVARQWGRLSAAGRATGRELPVTDGLLLATSLVHGLTLVTRHARDCANCGVTILDPWLETGASRPHVGDI
jgi:predicted nucleic acid-binding protein